MPESLLQGSTLLMLFIFLCFAALLVMFFRLMRTLDETTRSMQAERRSLLDHFSVMKGQLETLVRTQETQVAIMRSWETQAQNELFTVPEAAPAPGSMSTAASAGYRHEPSETPLGPDYTGAGLAAAAAGLAAAAVSATASQSQPTIAPQAGIPTSDDADILLSPDSLFPPEPESSSSPDQFLIQPEDINLSETMELSGFDISEDDQVLAMDEPERPAPATSSGPVVTMSPLSQVKLDETGEGESLEFFNDSMEFSLDASPDEAQLDIPLEIPSEQERSIPANKASSAGDIAFEPDFLISEEEHSTPVDSSGQDDIEFSLEPEADEGAQRVEMADDERRELDLLVEELVDVPDETPHEAAEQEEFEEAEVILAEDEPGELDLLVDEQESQSAATRHASPTAAQSTAASSSSFDEGDLPFELSLDDEYSPAPRHHAAATPSPGDEQEFELDLTGMDLLEEEKPKAQPASAPQPGAKKPAGDENIIDFIIEEE